MSRFPLNSLILFAALFLLSGCADDKLGPVPVPDNYLESLEEWREYRIDVLSGPTNWLRLDGIYWIEVGKTASEAEKIRTYNFLKEPFRSMLVW